MLLSQLTTDPQAPYYRSTSTLAAHGRPVPTEAQVRARALVAERRCYCRDCLAVLLDKSRPVKQRLSYLEMTQRAYTWLNDALRLAGLPTEVVPVLPTVGEILAAA